VPTNASKEIDKQIADLPDWRGKTLARLRRVIHEADPEIVEEVKYMGSPVWSHDRQVLVGNAFNNKVNLTFAEGVNIPDPEKLFNTGLEGNKRRGIDFKEGDKINEPALKELVRAAFAHNKSKGKK
jgi:hypothetical protein